MRDVLVAGAAMTRFGKFTAAPSGRWPRRPPARRSPTPAPEPSDIGMAFFANAVAGVLTGQEMIRGQVALRHTGLLGIPIVNVENACASASSAFSLACMAVARAPSTSPSPSAPRR